MSMIRSVGVIALRRSLLVGSGAKNFHFADSTYAARFASNLTDETFVNLSELGLTDAEPVRFEPV